MNAPAVATVEEGTDTVGSSAASRFIDEATFADRLPTRFELRLDQEDADSRPAG